MRSSPRGHAAVLALVLAAIALPARADWKRDYDRGTRAYSREQWSEAEAAFRAALAEEATPDARKRFQGVRTGVYVPHHYAAMAAWKQGACDRAMALWANAASTAVVASVPQLEAEQDRGMRDCRLRVATSAPAAVPAATPSVAQVPAATSPSSTTRPPPAASASPPASSPATAATRPPQAGAPAPSTTRPAAPPASTAPASTAATQAPAPQPAKPTGSAAPAALVTALDAYLAGNYDSVLQLDPARLADGRSRAQAHLLRAAALHRRAELAGSDALDDARRDVRSARAANASLLPDAALFPPRFVTFWKNTR